MSWIMANKRLVGSIVGIGLLVLFLLFVAGQIQSCRDRSEIDKARQKVDQLKEQSNQIQGELESLRRQKFEIDVAVNSARTELQVLQDETNRATENTNRALDNVNAVNSIDFNGTSTDSANRVRCQALPDSPECHR